MVVCDDNVCRRLITRGVRNGRIRLAADGSNKRRRPSLSRVCRPRATPTVLLCVMRYCSAVKLVNARQD